MSAVAVPAHEVEKARTELREAVDALTTAQVLDVELDDGSHTTAVVPALLASLDAEVTEQSQRSGSFAPKSRPPLWLDAVCLLQVIGTVTGARDEYRCEDVHTWGYRWSSFGTGTQIIDAARMAAGWLASVRELLDPCPKRWVRGVPCPRCGAVKVWDREDRDNDERFARPALRVDDFQAACVCDVCGAYWGVELFAHLQMVLEQQRAETLAVESWDPTPRLSPHPDLVQCSGRVRDHRFPDLLVLRRCPALLDEELCCPDGDRHEDT